VGRYSAEAHPKGANLLHCLLKKSASQLQGCSYLAVEELVAIVDTNSRKISSVMQRMRRQENTKSGQ